MLLLQKLFNFGSSTKIRCFRLGGVHKMVGVASSSPTISTNSLQLTTYKSWRLRRADNSDGVNKLFNPSHLSILKSFREEKVLFGITDVVDKYELLVFFSTKSLNIGKPQRVSFSSVREKGILQQEQITCCMLSHMMI